MFSFSWVTTPELQDVANKAIAQSAEAFRQWLGSRESSKKVYDVWWLTKGPLNFTSGEDARLYKDAVWKKANEIVEGNRTGPQNTDAPRV